MLNSDAGNLGQGNTVTDAGAGAEETGSNTSDAGASAINPVVTDAGTATITPVDSGPPPGVGESCDADTFQTSCEGTTWTRCNDSVVQELDCNGDDYWNDPSFGPNWTCGVRGCLSETEGFVRSVPRTPGASLPSMVDTVAVTSRS